MSHKPIEWRVRIVGRNTTREIKGFRTKRAAYEAALTYQKPEGFSPIVVDGRAYVVKGGS